jgi:hypothetical protein
VREGLSNPMNRSSVGLGSSFTPRRNSLQVVGYAVVGRSNSVNALIVNRSAPARQ